MTTPGGTGPDGAWVIGTIGGAQTLDEAAVYAATTGGVRGSYQNAQTKLKELTDPIDQALEEFEDSQLEMGDRIDLLEGVQGYCSLFLDRNWQITGNKRITLPFNTQLGPNKGASSFGGHSIKFAGKGLWRADGHVSFMTPPSNWWGGSPVNLQAWIKVYSTVGTGAGGAAGGAYTEKQYDSTVTMIGPETIAFSHTFVIPNDDAFAVCVQVSQPKSQTIGLYGGTLRSALSVNKWDNGTTNAVVSPTVPDGGTLT